MAAPDRKQLQFSIDEGPTFFADEISITNNDQRFFLDFKNQSPRIDPRASDVLPIAIKHNAIILDANLAKIFARMLTEHVERFENEHGKIPEPKVDPNKTVQTIISKTDDRPGYFG